MKKDSLRKAEPYLWILPSVILMGVFILIPIVSVFQMSMSDVSKAGKIKGFSGLANFTKVLRTPAFAMVLKKEDYASVVDLPASDSRVLRYLKGETLEVEDLVSSSEKAWQLVCVDGFPLGWGKSIGGVLKNKYLTGWRLC